MKLLVFAGAMLLAAISMAFGAPELAVLGPALIIASMAAISLGTLRFADRTPRSIFETRRAGLA
jgi:hypothetical protein